jgi:hypothetical protein
MQMLHMLHMHTHVLYVHCKCACGGACVVMCMCMHVHMHGAQVGAYCAEYAAVIECGCTWKEARGACYVVVVRTCMFMIRAHGVTMVSVCACMHA